MAVVVVVVDEGGDGLFERTRQEVVLQEDAVLQRLVPAFDLSLGLRGGGAPRTWSMRLPSRQTARSPDW
ncbi:hypothetical protein HDIA_3750 [Hartmannibacter diazotrophicus]|uniref:Uncharacterized protein n=1 Tax=Hartmannibacter diazotrophicus TaxID=1482074 RepID=A0A2C9DC43_9HYPH|nr:hypothetical protein HDIA_3750 [Hartmannibacter diazotrophicus]